jgi:hypothetical protein
VRDLKNSEWAELAISTEAVAVRDLDKSTKTPALRQTVAAFIQNMDRAVMLASLPASLLMTGRNIQLAHTGACVKLLNKPTPDLPHDSSRMGEIHLLAKDLFTNHENGPFPIVVAGNPSQTIEFVGGHHGQTFEFLLSMQLVAAWTAFETLAGDLWEATVNAHPHGLSQLAGRKKKGAEDKPGQEGKGDTGRMIPFSLLEKFDFKVSNAMGSIQRDMKKVTFTSLDEIRRAYVVAFADLAPGVYQILDDAALDRLSIVRNLIVHAAGVGDKEYIAKSEKKLLPQLKPGDPLELDGSLVSSLIAPVLERSTCLITTVDTWLSENLPPP